MSTEDTIIPSDYTAHCFKARFDRVWMKLAEEIPYVWQTLYLCEDYRQSFIQYKKHLGTSPNPALELSILRCFILAAFLAQSQHHLGCPLKTSINSPNTRVVTLHQYLISQNMRGGREIPRSNSFILHH